MAIFRKLTGLAWVCIGISMSIAACTPNRYELHEAFQVVNLQWGLSSLNKFHSPA